MGDIYDRLKAEAFSEALRKAVATPDDHEAIAAALDKLACDGHLDLSHEHRMSLFAAARIVRFAPVRPPMVLS
jgi:hypothetical protein